MIDTYLIMIILIDKQTHWSKMTTTKVIDEFNKKQPIDRNCSYNLRNRTQSQPLVQSESPSSVYEEIDELKRIELCLREKLKKQKNIEHMLRKELDDQRMLQAELIVNTGFYDYLENKFMVNKKRCPILHKFIIFIIYCITRISLIFSDILDIILEYPIISSIISTMTFLYIYPENLITIVDMKIYIIDKVIYIIDTGIFENYINMFKKYLILFKNMWESSTTRHNK